jgi:hypothetical protein
VLADIGNDLAYGAPVETIVDWVETALDRLSSVGASAVVNNVPLDSLLGVGAARYRLFRELFFPNCPVPRRDMLARARRLSGLLEDLAARRKTPIFSGENAWYGFAPIHPRRRAAGEIWRRMLGALAPDGAPTRAVRPDARTAWRLRRLKPSQWSEFGLRRRAAQPSGRLADGTTIALY